MLPLVSLASSGEQGQDVERPQRTGLLGRVVIEVDRGQRLRQRIDIANGDQPVPDVVGPLLGAERILQQQPGVAFVFRTPALGLVPMTVELRPEVQSIL